MTQTALEQLDQNRQRRIIFRWNFFWRRANVKSVLPPTSPDKHPHHHHHLILHQHQTRLDSLQILQLKNVQDQQPLEQSLRQQPEQEPEQHREKEEEEDQQLQEQTQQQQQTQYKQNSEKERQQQEQQRLVQFHNNLNQQQQEQRTQQKEERMPLRIQETEQQRQKHSIKNQQPQQQKQRVLRIELQTHQRHQQQQQQQQQKPSQRLIKQQLQQVTKRKPPVPHQLDRQHSKQQQQQQQQQQQHRREQQHSSQIQPQQHNYRQKRHENLQTQIRAQTRQPRNQPKQPQPQKQNDPTSSQQKPGKQQQAQQQQQQLQPQQQQQQQQLQTKRQLLNHSQDKKQSEENDGKQEHQQQNAECLQRRRRQRQQKQNQQQQQQQLQQKQQKQQKQQLQQHYPKQQERENRSQKLQLRTLQYQKPCQKHQPRHRVQQQQKQQQQQQQQQKPQLQLQPYTRDQDQQSGLQEGKQQPCHSNKNLILSVTHFNLFLYACCFTMQSAVLPYLTKQMGAEPMTYGYLQSMADFLQLGGGLVFSRLHDVFGSRSVMTLAFTSSACCYLGLYMSSSIPGLFLSKLPALFMHSYQGSQVLVSEMTHTSGRPAALARLGVSFQLGLVAGRLVGGWIATLYSLKTAALLAFLGSTLSLVLVQTTIPPKETSAKVIKENKGSGLFTMRKFYDVLNSPGVLFLVLIKIGSELPMFTFQSMFSIITLNTFNLSADRNSYLQSYVGLLSMLVQGLGVSYITRRFSRHSIMAATALVLTVSYVTLSLVTNLGQLCVVFLPLTTGVTLQQVIMTSALTDTVADSDTGTMIGLSKSFVSLTRTVSPTVGGYMMENVGFPAFGHLGFVSSAAVTLALVINKCRKEPKPKNV